MYCDVVEGKILFAVIVIFFVLIYLAHFITKCVYHNPAAAREHDELRLLRANEARRQAINERRAATVARNRQRAEEQAALHGGAHGAAPQAAAPQAAAPQAAAPQVAAGNAAGIVAAHQNPPAQGLYPNMR